MFRPARGGTHTGPALRRAMLSVTVTVWLASPTTGQTSPEDTAARSGDEPDVADVFADFVHFARLGRFDAADAMARVLVSRPDLDPVALLHIADRDPTSRETLITIINNSTIGENAARVLEIIREGEHRQRREAERIRINVDKLGGSPQAELDAIRTLVDSGEYAVPWMIEALGDETKQRLHVRIARTLPRIGRPAINPLVAVLASGNADRVRLAIDALGAIGYRQAVPYLLKAALDESVTPELRQAAVDAIARIESSAGRRQIGSPAEAFFRLAERYYNEDDAVKADPRLAAANVWYLEDEFVTAVVVPTRIFGSVMAMRSCEEALAFEPDHAGALALWLAADFRREARLGMDVESGDPSEAGEADDTRPAGFPRAIYFARAAGPRYCHLVLDRAVGDGDAAVALGAIAALRVVAGPSSLVGLEDYKQPLVRALQFPDPLVRLKAALTLGEALPRSPFAGSEHVVPILAKALVQSGAEHLVVVVPDQDALNETTDALRGAVKGDVIGDTGLLQALQHAQMNPQAISALFLSTAIQTPDVGAGLRQLRGHFEFARTPVILLVERPHEALVERLRAADPALGAVASGTDDAGMLAELAAVRQRSGQAPLDPALADALALQTAETLRRMAADGRSVYDLAPAVRGAIVALNRPREPLQQAVATVLALLPDPSAQQALAATAALDAYSVELRVALFGSLAESAKHFANMLSASQIDRLVELAADEPDLTLRTAASQALGALNLSGNQASELVRKYHRG